MTKEEIGAGMAMGRSLLVEKHRSLTFEEFKARMQDGSLRVLAERMDSRIHDKGQITMTAIFMALYQFFPLLVSIGLAIGEHSWLYLVAPVAGVFAVRSSPAAISGLTLCLLLGAWIAGGTSGHPWFALGAPSWLIYTGTIVVWCGFWFQMADGAVKAYTDYNLLHSESTFIRARDEGIVVFVG